MNTMDAPGYEQLASVLQRAYDQAARGKGKERHANNKPFHHQPMQDLIRLHGVGFATGQASKKSGEALGLPTLERQVAELLGAIVYLSGAVIALEAAAGTRRETPLHSSEMHPWPTAKGFGPWTKWDGFSAAGPGLPADCVVRVRRSGAPEDDFNQGRVADFNWTLQSGLDAETNIGWYCVAR